MKIQNDKRPGINKSNSDSFGPLRLQMRVFSLLSLYSVGETKGNMVYSVTISC